MGMIASGIENKNVFKFFLALWIMSLPFKNAVYQISFVLLVLFFITHLVKTRNFTILVENFKQTYVLSIGFALIIFTMLLANILNLEYLDKKSWNVVYMFVLRYGLVFVILAYFYKLEYFTKKEIFIFLLSSFSFLGLTGLYQIINNPSVILGEGVVGTLNNRNAFGLFMGMGFILSLYTINYKKNLAFYLIPFFTFLMIFSFSRSSWVASSATIFVLICLNYKSITIKHFGYFIIFLIFLILLYFSFDSLQLRFSQLINGDSSFRTTIWIKTMALIKERLLVGYGVDSWMNLSDPYLKEFPDPHNMTLEILIYTGLLGFIACYFTILVILYKIIKDKNLMLLPIAIYFLVITQFDFGAFFSKELLSFLTIFVFFVYSNSFKQIR